MKNILSTIILLFIFQACAENNTQAHQFSPNNQTYPYGVMLRSSLNNIKQNAETILQHISMGDNPMPWITGAIIKADVELESVATVYSTQHP